MSGFGLGGYYLATVNHQADQSLLRQYAQAGSEPAFAELVRRYVDFVYSVALRTVLEPDLARDVAQSVFIVLAHECGRVAEHGVLAGWLHRTTHNLAVKAVRTEARRRRREQQAATMNELFSTEPEGAWKDLAPHLDAALEQLKPEDRDVVLLRYFQQKSAREIAALLGLSEEAAQKRAVRALERLRSAFAVRGVAASSAAVAVLLSANAVQAAPAGLGMGIAAAAAASHSAIGAGLIKVMTMTTMQKMAVTTTVVALAVGGAVYEAQRASGLERKLAALQPQQPQALSPSAAGVPQVMAQAPDAAQSSSPTRVFNWQQVESPDYRQYLANLRAIGCPEKTIRDIIRADVKDLYGQRLKAAMPPATNRFEYWKPGNPFAQFLSEQMTNAQALASERRQLIATLLGKEDDEGPETWMLDLAKELSARALNCLAPEKRAAVEDLQAKMSVRLSNANSRDRQAWKQVLAEVDAALLQVLTPEEKFEYDVRRGRTADLLRAAIQGMDVTEEEFRNLVRLQKQYDDDFGPPLYPPEGPKAVAAFKAMHQDFAKLLGEERYRQFLTNRRGS